MYFAGIDVGGTNLKAGIVDEDFNLVCTASVPTNVGRDARKIIKDMADLVKTLAKDSDIALTDITSIGIGIPGVAKNGVVVALHNLFWQDVQLKSIFNEYLDIPVFIDNDATVAAVYEYHLGVLAGCKVGVFLTLGTGVGGGIIINGKAFNGAHGLGGELGHIAVVPDGLQCTCGNKGCLEVYASATALVRMGRRCVIERPDSMLGITADEDYHNVTAKMVIDVAKQGDRVAISIVDEYAKFLSIGITSIINTLDPEVIALGGGVSHAGKYLLDKVIAACDEKGVFENQKYAEIKIAKSGNDAGIIGAAMLTE
ncbi:MAG: ROK family glucokinase [Clostridia bacterium]|jgi:glucokinase|nr:ROK family glucokinase [Clostridia bacterium]MBT7122614.1 ROK family glucokinase [Clostridia bacterium]